MTRHEAADYLRVSIATLRRLPLPKTYSRKTARYLKEDLDAHLRANRVEPAKPVLEAASEPAKPADGKAVNPDGPGMRRSLGA